VAYARQDESGDRVHDLVGVGGLSGLPIVGAINGEKTLEDDILADPAGEHLPVSAGVRSGDGAAVGGEDFGVVEVVPAPMRAKIRKPRSKKVLDFAALKGAKQSKKGGQPHLPARGQEPTEWLKSILPSPKPGAWWEAPADDKGFKIKLRWRAGGKKLVYAFARLGKKEVEKLKEKTYEEQKRALSGRIFRELYRRGDKFITARITPYAGSGERFGSPGL